jgi:hypothetical protein
MGVIIRENPNEKSSKGSRDETVRIVSDEDHVCE